MTIVGIVPDLAYELGDDIPEHRFEAQGLTSTRHLVELSGSGRTLASYPLHNYAPVGQPQTLR